jgi:hypothetical protein
MCIYSGQHTKPTAARPPAKTHTQQLLVSALRPTFVAQDYADTTVWQVLRLLSLAGPQHNPTLLQATPLLPNTQL